MRLRRDVAPKDVRRRQAAPEVRNNCSARVKLIATRRESGAVNRPGRTACDDRERIAVRLDPADLTDALENARLVSSASAAAHHDQTQGTVQESLA